MGKEKKKQKHKYIFPNVMATAMAKVDLRTQYEASMMSMSLILVGIVMTGIYMMFYIDVAWWYKIFLGVNALGGLVFLSSMLVTTYQQFISYMEVVDFQKDTVKGGEKKDGF